MHLRDWLFSERLVTQHQYAETVQEVFCHTKGALHTDSENRLVSKPIGVLQPTQFRRHPVGEVIDSMPLAKDVYRRAGVSDLTGLVAKWQQWHVDNLEPLVDYPTGSEYARHLYRQQVEKKLVAWFLANVPVRDRPLISDTDNVVIPDGSSAFYVGLAVAAWRKDVCLISSNGPLYCEYLTNPAFSNAVREFYFIGGEADRRLPSCGDGYHHSVNGGTFGDAAKDAYQKAIDENPGATVVVLPVSGLLPEDGPLGRDSHTRELKRFLIQCSLTHGVRQLVFVADYTKHRRDNMNEYGLPILNASSDWKNVLTDHHERISLVTAPSPEMRDLLRGAQPIHPAERLSAHTLQSNAHPSAKVAEYNQVAREFGGLFQDALGRPSFHEVGSMSEECSKRASLVSKTPAPVPTYPPNRAAGSSSSSTPSVSVRRSGGTKKA